MTIHPKAKRWVEVVEFIGFPICAKVAHHLIPSNW